MMMVPGHRRGLPASASDRTKSSVALQNGEAR
jgi:hypothetical protein